MDGCGRHYLSRNHSPHRFLPARVGIAPDYAASRSVCVSVGNISETAIQDGGRSITRLGRMNVRLILYCRVQYELLNEISVFDGENISQLPCLSCW